MAKLIIVQFLVLLSIILSDKGIAQDRIRPYLNAGYITGLTKCDDCIQADRGGSIRIGILTKKRLGFYAGYLWFKVFHADYIPYDDKGSMFMAGIDFLLLKKGIFKGYVKLGLGNEKFISVYPTRAETESSIKPDFGLLFNFNRVNAYTGWQPSEPSHFNLGIGFTF